MASPAQIAANRLNSRKSTGPRTPGGHASSADTNDSPSGAEPQGALRLAAIDTAEFSNQDA